jgi:exocyst complex component 2
MEIANTIDEKLFADYTRRRAKTIKEIVKKGILNGIDWSSLKQPFGPPSPFPLYHWPLDVQPYVHQALLSLVITHAQVTSTSPTILPRVLTSLIESFSTDLLASFRKVPSFCMGGMLQATLEVEFLHQTLGGNVSKAAGETLQAVYGTIEKSYEGSGGVDLELGKVKGLLQRSRAGTKFVYSCFRTKKNGGKGDGKSDGGSSSRAASVRSKT